MDDTTSFAGKKVLLFCPPFYSMHNQIIKALENLGASVGFIPDTVQKFNPHFEANSLRLIKKVYYQIAAPNKKYLSSYSNIINQFWDFFFCIDGYSFDRCVIDILKQNNPDIKRILYLWDSINFYDFSINFDCFDSVYTFDPSDAERYKLKYLPLYWSMGNTRARESHTTTIDLSFVGTAHTDRFRIIDAIATQCDKNNIKYCFKLIISKRSINFSDKVRYFLYSKCNSPSAIGFSDEYKIRRGEIQRPYITFTPLSGDQVANIISKSNCILDISKPGQQGLTNRMIEALAAGKKIITTNGSYLGLDLDSPNIMYINRKTPLIDCNFLLSPPTNNAKNSKAISKLEIKNWVSTILLEE